MSYDCKILADSLSPGGVRLTTLCCTFPRFILAEVNTHRMLSRNSASSRAIPPEKLIQRVVEDPFVPETFNARVKGMGVGDPLPEDEQEYGRSVWLDARDAAVKAAQALVDGNVDKSRVNRLLEPFMWHTAIISATEWENFLALRDHPDAQPEFQIIARMMRLTMEGNTPVDVREGGWHLPLTPDLDLDYRDWDFWAEVSASRCARVSFDTHGQYEEPDKSHERAERLKSSGHLSPFEHVARPTTSYFWFGNFRGWLQYRKLISHEDNFAYLMESKV